MGLRHRVYLAKDRTERLMGPTSLRALALDVKENVLDGLRNDVSRTLEAISASRKLVQLMDSWDQPTKLLADGQPVKPPQSILEAMMSCYFESFNPILPLWTREGFNKLASSCEAQQHPGLKRVYAVSASNMILLTLTTKSLQAESERRSRSRSPNCNASSPMEGDFSRTFVTNARRAINNLELLVHPRIENIQALLSLCRVAQLHLTDDMVRLTFSLAVYLARSIGLDHSKPPEQQPGSELGAEKRNILHCLSVLERTTCWTTGSHPWATGCHGLELSRIEEKVFSLLYSRDPRTKDVRTFQRGVSTIRQELERWRGQQRIDSGGVQERGKSIGDADSTKLARAISFHYISILAAMPTACDYVDQDSITNQSRACLGLLARLLTSYPPVAFLQLFRHIVTREGIAEAEDLHLLQSFLKLVAAASDMSAPESYLARLHCFVKLLTDFAVSLARGDSEARTVSMQDQWYEREQIDAVNVPGDAGGMASTTIGSLDTIHQCHLGEIYADSKLSNVPDAGGDLFVDVSQLESRVNHGDLFGSDLF
ncbi:uncharacterized protein N7482_004523 [Penicillium canariense]|uniref:Transcription factor domain-containing protein n=1 Tax=Penicillium canariense TaxID=189055 RepID=A0A9W9I6I5_9EURO|nr:uncharacterized protein N7482_004523 [Penicillium canariense]KAJ5168929.1 hypothetical protein N7482_004523 [Penicillium canariense]